MIKQFFVVLLGLIATPVFSMWSVNNEQSALHFLTTKNSQVSEVHAFDSVSGSVSPSGKLTIEVPLATVNTAIPIRNTRMQEMLFEVAKYPVATFTADIPATLMSLAVGSTSIVNVDGTLSLHGLEAPVSFNVSVSKTSSSQMVVTTVAPTLIGAATFNLTAGVEALRNIAGLKTITPNVPVTFTVTFEK